MDTYYLTAFVLQGWLGQLVSQTTTEYAEKKNAKDRVMQTGQAWRGFREIFRSDQELPQFLGQMLRFTEFDHSLAALLRRALVPLWVEHECSGEYFGPKAMDLAKNPKAGLDLALRSLERWCDWIDALIHFKTHEHWHFAPACFDPDPDKRELASLGTNQRHLTVLSEGAREWWEWHFSEAAERFKNSPEWQMLGKAMISQSDKAWPYREADTLIISLWPLAGD